MKTKGYKGNKNVISARLIEARIKADMTQGDLAARMQIEQISIDQQGISKIENNQRIVTEYELGVMGKICNVTPEWMLGEIFDKQN